MPRAHDYRYDPYSDIPSQIELKERHIVPIVSPFIVELCEVPIKAAPSTTVVKYITSIDGDQLAYGTTLTEVSSTPSQGQYFPDYHTNADNNSGWNTGKILFAAADAGKLVEITYLGKGTLASVRANSLPAWWTDRGDGSDGDFCPTQDVTITGRRNYKSVYIKSGVKVTAAGPVDICCQGAFFNAGEINGNGAGCRGGRGGSAANFGLIDEDHYNRVLLVGALHGEASGGGYGGAGGGEGFGNVSRTLPTIAGADVVLGESVISYYMSIPEPQSGCGGSGGEGRTHGSWRVGGGTPGGHGGAGIQIRCHSFKNVGLIVTNGDNTVATGYNSQGGGGGGGTVKVICKTKIAEGTIIHNGGIPSGGSGARAETGGEGWHRIIELGVM